MKKNFILISLLFLLIFVIGCNIENYGDINNSNKKDIIEINVMESIGYSNLTTLIQKVKPSVVDIYAYSTSSSSAGSGVIVGKSTESYYVVTNHHVIDGANEFEIVTYNTQGITTTYESQLVGTSLKNDVAVLEIQTTDELTIASIIDDSNKVKIGTEVIAIGNPLGILGGSVTHGIISATEREVYISDLGYMNLFQTDAAINSGNSGGALFSYEGVLIGIVNSGYTNYEGLNFAIPSNIVVECFKSIIKTRTSTSYGYMKGEADLGITLLDATIYSDNTLKTQVNIIYVAQVAQNSDASKNNILDYESFSKGKTDAFYALSKINGKEIESLLEAMKVLDNIESNVTITLEFIEITYYKKQGFFSQSALYLTENIKQVTIYPTQYIYTIS